MLGLVHIIIKNTRCTLHVTLLVHRKYTRCTLHVTLLIHIKYARCILHVTDDDITLIQIETIGKENVIIVLIPDDFVFQSFEVSAVL